MAAVDRSRAADSASPLTERHIEERQARSLSSLSPRSVQAVRALAVARLDPVRAELAREGTSLERLQLLTEDPHQEPAPKEAELYMGEAIGRLMPQWDELTRRARTVTDDDAEPAWDSVTSQLEVRIVEELDLARTNLLGREAELFSTVDRLRSEAEFRSALALPLVALATALGWRAGWLAPVLVVAAAFALLSQALVRLRQSNDALIEAIRLDRAQAPALAQVKALADALAEVVQRVREQFQADLQEAARQQREDLGL